MKKPFLILTICFVLVGVKFCDAQFSIGINGGAQVPSGNTFKNLVNTGYGIVIAGEYKIPSTPLALILSSGYDNWGYKNLQFYAPINYHTYTIIYENISMYSFVAEFGPKLYIDFPKSNFSAYVGADAGIMALSSTVQNATYNSGIIYSPFIGCRYKFSRNILLDLNLSDSNYKQNDTKDMLSWYGVCAGVFYAFR